MRRRSLPSQDDRIVPILGTKHRKYVEKNVGAIDINFTADELDRIEEIMPRSAAAGPRYPEQKMQEIEWE